jgi:thiosulfate/3-mercaptopyruvate sulfurtransferase
MSTSPLISTQELSEWLSQPELRLFDCRTNLSDPAWGRQDYLSGHIPGAIYADLKHNLAGPVSPASGRHPLPETGVFAKLLSNWGVTAHSKLVVYDTTSGSYAGRLWMMLHAVGFSEVRLLDGGYTQWVKENRPTRSGEEVPLPAAQLNALNYDPAWLVDAAQVADAARNTGMRVVDARATERFQGLQEPIDAVAGHIPGAANRFYGLNLDENGLFKPAEQLRQEFEQLLGDVPASQAIVYCGSGVTSCHHLIALQQAGLPGARIYIGSWSEWIRDPARPIATGL